MTRHQGMRYAVVAAAIVTAGPGAGTRADVRDERRTTRTVRFSETGARSVDVRVPNGSVRIVGDGGSDVRIDMLERFEAETQADLDTAKQRLSLDTRDGGRAVDVVVRDDGWTGCDNPSWPRRGRWRDRDYDVHVELTVRIPRDANVKVCGVNSSGLRVEDTTGDFEVTLVNGRVVLTGLGGAGRVTTVNGQVDATFTSQPKAPTSFKTVNGEVIARYPANLAADLRMKTLHGDLLTDFETQVVARGAGEARRDGLRRVGGGGRRNDFSTFRVGAGGPELTFETVNGDVRVLKGAR